MQPTLNVESFASENSTKEICLGAPNSDSDRTSGKRNLTIECIESIEGLASLSLEIDRLSNVPFLQTAWMVAWLQAHRAQYEAIKFLVCRNHDEVVAFLPLVLCRSLKKGRHLVFVGSGRACADFMTIPGEESVCPDVINLFSDWIWNIRSQWDLIELDGVQCNASAIRELVKNLNEKGGRSALLPSLSTWRTQFPENWQAFEAAMSKNSRKKIRRLARGLEEANAKFRYVDDRASLEQGLAILKMLHTKRWVSLGEPGCYATPGFEEFIALLAHAHLQQGTLRLVWLELDGQPIAADIAFVCGDGLFTYQGGIEPDQLKWEPGRSILRCQIERAMGEGLNFVDFLRGDEGYKSRWQAIESDTVRIQVCSTGLRSQAIRCFLWTGRKAKSFCKNVLALRKKR